jgi:TonB family protein
MNLVSINIEKKEDEYSLRRRWIALGVVILFHALALFSLNQFGFDRTYPPPPMRGIEISVEVVNPRPQGTPRKDPHQKAVADPPVVNAPGNTAPESAKVSTSNESTKPMPQPEAKPSELSDKGDVAVKTPEPKINNKALFQSTNQGDVEADNPTPIDEDSESPGVGRVSEPTRTQTTPLGPDHRQTITHNLEGRSVMGGFPSPAYKSQNEGFVVVEITVNQDGKVIKAEAIPKGSTVQDVILWKAAVEAAMKARFNVKKDAPISQVGTITYMFKLQ